MSENARILVVDDDESIRKTIAVILESEGYMVDTAENGKDAIKKSYSEFYNLALIDVRLPDMEGTELLTKMKETTPKMVKIIVTGYPSIHNAIAGVNNGANAYVQKPVNTENLLNLIKQCLQMQQEDRRYSEQKVAEFIETRAREICELDLPAEKD